MPRSRGVRSLTSRPPIRISPDVGSSSPAIIRRSVVLPEPEGPRRTRNSPSRLSRSTLTTAPTFPRLKTLFSLRVSTTAIPSFPLGENTPQLGVGRLDRRFGCHLIASGLREHRRNDECVERFVNGCCRVARISDVGRPRENVAEHGILVVRY